MLIDEADEILSWHSVLTEEIQHGRPVDRVERLDKVGEEHSRA